MPPKILIVEDTESLALMSVLSDSTRKTRIAYNSEQQCVLTRIRT